MGNWFSLLPITNNNAKLEDKDFLKFLKSHPDTAPADVLKLVQAASRDMQETRRQTIERVISKKSRGDTSGKLR